MQNNLLVLIVVTLALLAALVLVVLAGVALTARSYTALLDMIREVGFKVAQNALGIQQVRTSSSTKMEPDGSYALPEDSHTTPDNPPPL